MKRNARSLCEFIILEEGFYDVTFQIDCYRIIIIFSILSVKYSYSLLSFLFSMLDFWDATLSLNDFIKQVRTCKTKQKEREMVAEEGRKMREIINAGDTTSMEVGKLLFIQMLGYDVEYAIMP